MIKKIIKIPLEGLKNLNNYLVEETFLSNYIGEFLVKTGLFLYKGFFKKINRRILLTLFKIIPRIIVIVTFIIDLWLFNKIYYVYIVSVVLLLPLIERVIQYNLEQLCTKNLEQLNNILDIYDKNTQIKIKSEDYLLRVLTNEINIKIYDMQLNPNFVSKFDSTRIDYEKTLERYEDYFFNVLFPIQTFLLVYNADKNKILYCFNILFYSCYILIWSYVIITSW